MAKIIITAKIIGHGILDIMDMVKIGACQI